MVFIGMIEIKLGKREVVGKFYFYERVDNFLLDKLLMMVKNKEVIYYFYWFES